MMLNNHLKTSGYFLYTFWAKFPQIAPIPEYLRNRYNSTNREPWTRVTLESKLESWTRVSLDVKEGAEDFRLVLMCPCTRFGVFRISFPKLPQYPSTCETGITQPTKGLDTRVRSPFMWNKDLKTSGYF